MSRSMLLLMTERKEDSHAIFPSNLEQTRVYFREMESLDVPLTAPRAPCLLIDLGSCFYSAALRPATATTTSTAKLHYSRYTASKQCLEHRPRALPDGTACRLCLEAALCTQPLQTHHGEVLPAS